MLQLSVNPSLRVTKTICTKFETNFSDLQLFSAAVPWHCRCCVGSCCLYGKERSTGGRSRDGAACRAAGSCLLPRTLPGGRSVCSGAFHRAAFYYTSGHKKCLADDMGCCCVAASQRRELITGIKTRKK